MNTASAVQNACDRSSCSAITWTGGQGHRPRFSVVIATVLRDRERWRESEMEREMERERERERETEMEREREMEREGGRERVNEFVNVWGR